MGLTRLLLLCLRIDRPDWNREWRVLETIIHALSVLRVPDEPSGVTTTHGRLRNVDHVLQRNNKVNDGGPSASVM